MLKGKKILIGISGSIAAYKIPLLIRLLIKEGAEVKVVMSSVACDFVTPLTLSTLSQKPVLIEPYNKVDGSWNSHVEWGRWADVFIMAPVSANTLAKMAAGIADNLLTTTYLAAKCPVFFAPAMDLDMFHHPTTKRNVNTLLSFGNRLIEPQVGELASGLCGEGRMEEPEVIFEVIKGFFLKTNDLSGKKILISAGPTYESIDPVRFIGNHSSGKMGFAIAQEAANRGAEVILVSGPVDLQANHPKIKLIKVKSADQMAEECFNEFPACDICIMSAAVGDYKVAEPSRQKIKKTDSSLSLELVKNIDILAGLGKIKTDSQFLTGFALETENENFNAKEKLRNKNLDLIVLNSLNDAGSGFGTDTNKVKLFFKDGDISEMPLKSKVHVAADIIDAILSKI